MKLSKRPTTPEPSAAIDVLNVVEASQSPGQPSTTMKRFFELMRSLWRAGLPAANGQAKLTPDRVDRSSMADFVRILQEADRVREKEDA